MVLLEPSFLFRDGALREGEAVLVDDDGTIVAVGPRRDCAARVERLEGLALLPGLVSAHSHAFQVLLRGWADHPRDFADWVATRLYPLVLALDDETLELASTLCFAEMARAGISCVGEFHYVHDDRDGAPRGNDLDRLVLRAARRVGLRVAFLRAIYDVKEKPGQRRFFEPVDRALESTRALASEHSKDPLVSVLPAPHSLHGAGRSAFEGAAALARERGTLWHAHLAEQRSDVDRALAKYGTTPLRVLESWGVLNARSVLVHGVWLDEGERALLADRGGALVSCPGTSIALGDGVADLADFLERGVAVGLGTDMNRAPDVLFEARLAEDLQRARRHAMGVLSQVRRGGPRGPAALLDLATRGGARALGLSGGDLAPGKPFDAVALDALAPSLAPALARGPEALLAALVSTGSPALVRHVWVAGRRIVSDGAVLSVEPCDLAARLREHLARLRVLT